MGQGRGNSAHAESSYSDKQAERWWHAAMPLFGAGIAYFFPSVPGHSVVFIIGWFTVAGVLTAYLSTFWAIPTEIFRSSHGGGTN